MAEMFQLELETIPTGPSYSSKIVHQQYPVGLYQYIIFGLKKLQIMK